MKKKICVIGAGLGGLSASIRLANNGFEVDLYEQNNTPGGKAGEIKERGYRFDTGPSLLTMPQVLKDLFSDCNENLEDYLKINRLDLICKYFYPDKSIINAYSDVDKFGKEINEKTSDNSESLNKYLNYCKTIYDLAGDLFLTKDLSNVSTYINSKAVKNFIKH